MRDDDDLLTIGEVAKLDGVSTKALRYYDAHGILVPIETDPRTGYRYYAPDQLLEMDVIRLCLEAGVPLDSIETFHQTDGSLDWRTLMETGRDRVAREIARLRTLETSLNDYLGEMTRKARTPADGVVRSDLPPTWMVGRPWPYYGGPFVLKPYLRAMTLLRTAVREAGLPRLLRRGIIIDCREGQAYAYQQFEPGIAKPRSDAAGNAMTGIDATGIDMAGIDMAGIDMARPGAAGTGKAPDQAISSTDDRTAPINGVPHAGDDPIDSPDFGFDPSLTVFHPTGGPAEGQVIERESLTACFDDALAMVARNDPDKWPHATVCEIWGSHTADGWVRVRYTRHRCDVGRTA